MRVWILAAVFLVTLAAPAAAQGACNDAAPAVVTMVALPGSPFSAIATKDGCTIFVSITGGQSDTLTHIAVLRRADGKVTLAHDIPVAGDNPGGMAISPDGGLLAVANGTGVVLFDTARLAAGDGAPLAGATDQGNGAQAGSVYVAISPDDKLLFVSDELVHAITVYDLARLRGGDTDAIGRIQTGGSPVGLAFSPDGSRLYSTSEVGQAGTSRRTCPRGDGSPGLVIQGQLTIIDVARAATNLAGAVLARVPVGCQPVRVAVSADGARVYVTARGADSLLVFDSSKLTGDPDHALAASIPVGKSPVGIALADSHVITADSDRFGLPAPEWLSVVDPAAARLLGYIPAGSFPRELSVTADGKTLLATNFNSNSLEIVDLVRLTPDYFAEQEVAKKKSDADYAVRLARVKEIERLEGMK